MLVAHFPMRRRFPGPTVVSYTSWGGADDVKKAILYFLAASAMSFLVASTKTARAYYVRTVDAYACNYSTDANKHRFWECPIPGGSDVRPPTGGLLYRAYFDYTVAAPSPINIHLSFYKTDYHGNGTSDYINISSPAAGTYDSSVLCSAGATNNSPTVYDYFHAEIIDATNVIGVALLANP
jgi:hypothetical protein